MNKRTTGLFYHCVIFNKNNMDSKLEVRAAAVKLASKVDGVNNENVVDVAKFRGFSTFLILLINLSTMEILLSSHSS